MIDITKTIVLTEAQLKIAISDYIKVNGIELPEELAIDLEFYNGAQELSVAFSSLKVSWDDTK